MSAAMVEMPPGMVGSVPVEDVSISREDIALVWASLRGFKRDPELGESVAICEGCKRNLWADGGSQMALMVDGDVWEATEAERFLCLACIEFRVGFRLQPRHFRTDPHMWPTLSRSVLKQMGVTRRNGTDGAIFTGDLYFTGREFGWWAA